MSLRTKNNTGKLHKKVSKIEKEIFINSDTINELSGIKYSENKSNEDIQKSAIDVLHEGTEKILKEVAQSNNDQIMELYNKEYDRSTLQKRIGKIKDQKEIDTVNFY